MAVIDDLRDQVEIEGYKPGTRQFEHRFAVVRAERCRDIRQIMACEECPIYDHCTLIHQLALLRTTR